MPVPTTAIVRPPASSVAVCASVSMPLARPETTVTPSAASCSASRRARERPCVGGLPRADDGDRAGVLAAQLAAVEQKRRRAREAPAGSTGYSARSSTVTSRAPTLRLAPRRPRSRALLHTLDRGSAAPRRETCAASPRRRGTVSATSPAQAAVASPPARSASRAITFQLTPVDRAQREQPEVDVAAEIERGVAVAVGRRQEWCERVLPRSRRRCARTPSASMLISSSTDAPDTPLSPTALGKRPGSCRSRGATPMLSDRVRSERIRNDAKRDHGFDDRPDAGARATRRARPTSGPSCAGRSPSIEATTGGPDVTTAEGRVALFTSLFRGRPDVFATRWESTKSPGKSGWAPRCLNEWRPGVCEKQKVKCADCAQPALRCVVRG